MARVINALTFSRLFSSSRSSWDRPFTDQLVPLMSQLTLHPHLALITLNFSIFDISFLGSSEFASIGLIIFINISSFHIIAFPVLFNTHIMMIHIYNDNMLFLPYYYIKNFFKDLRLPFFKCNNNFL